MMMIAKAVSSGIEYLGDRKRADEKMDLYGELRRSGERDANRLTTERESLYSMGPTMRKYMQYAMEDPTADLERRAADRSSATALGALKGAGAKALLGGLGRQQQQAADVMAGIGQREFTRKTNALQAYGNIEQGLRGARRRDVSADLTLARQQAKSGLIGGFQAQQAKSQAGTDFLSQLVTTGGNIAGAEFGTATEGGDLMRDYMNDSSNDGDYLEPLEGFGKNGTKVKKTPGVFSHRRNPIDVMQGGSKIGELTGGEYVLNPEQAAAIARQSDIARKLFRKFDKEAR